MQFGDKLRELLEEREISQKDFAATLNIAPTTLNGYINNKRQPDLELVKRIAFILNVTTDHLLGFDSGGVMLSIKELSLISRLRQLDEGQQAVIYDLVNISAGRVQAKKRKSAK